MNKSIYIFWLFIISSCETPPISQYRIIYPNIPNVSTSNNIYSNIVLDSFSIYMGGENMTSMEGVFFLQKDSIYFGDKQLASVFTYNLSGQFASTKIQQGKGPKEILGLNTIAPCDSGFVIMDDQWNIFLFDQNWIKTRQYPINWQTKKSAQSLMNNPDPNEPSIYEVEYACNNLRPFGHKYLLFPIVTEHVHYNGYEGKNASHFYDNSHTLALMEKSNGNVLRIFCNRSPVYLQYHFLPNFKNVIFDTYSDTLFFSFEADTLIYKINLPNTIPSLSFGMAGKDLNTSYVETRSLKESDKNYMKDRETYGFYHYLKYIPETSVLFRGFSSGSPKNITGLQIYKNACLLGELEVPKDFKVFGYHEPYYYASGKPNYDNDQIIIYRFYFN